MMLLPVTKGLGVNNNLVLTVDCCNAVIALDGSFAGGHLSAFIVGDVAFDLFLRAPLALLGRLGF